MSVDVKAVLRIMGDSLCPAVVSKNLGLTAYESYSKGDAVPLHPERIRPIGYWSLRSEIDTKAPLREHIEHLLNAIDGKDELMNRLIDQSDLSAGIYCGLFVSGEFEPLILNLAPELMKKLSQAGLSLDVNCYVD